MQSILYSSTFSPLSLPNFGTPFSSLETVSITPLPPLRVNNNRFPSQPSIWCVIDFFCSLSILCVCFFDGGVVFSITVSLEAYLRVILVVVLRSRCYADAIRIEARLLSTLYTLTRNFGNTDSENQTHSVTRSYFTSLQNNIPDVSIQSFQDGAFDQIGWNDAAYCLVPYSILYQPADWRFVGFSMRI